MAENSYIRPARVRRRRRHRRSRLGGAGPRPLILSLRALVLLLLVGLPVLGSGQEAEEPAEEGTEEEEAPTELRRFELEERERGLFDPAPAAEVPPLRSTTLFPATLAPAVFPPRYHRVGDFALSAVTTVGATYDDNIEADNDDREDGTALGASASARAQSLFARHSLGFSASAAGSYFLDESEESDLAWVVGTDGRIDLSRRSSISASASYTQGTEDPESPDIDDDAEETPEFWHGNARVGYDISGRRLGWGLGGSVSHTDFDNVDPDDRDRTTYTASTNLRYRSSERLTLTSALSYGFSRFPNEPADVRSRDSDRATGTVGAVYDLGQRLSVGASVGYSRIFFEDETRDDKGSIVGDASISWTLPGRKTSVSLGLDHSISTTTTEDAATRQTTSAVAGVTRVLGESTSLSGSLGLAHSQFDNDEPAQDTLQAQIGLGHAFNRTFGAGIGYRYSQRFSSEEESEFYRNVVFVGVTANF